jgi:hypothetical protein
MAQDFVQVGQGAGWLGMLLRKRPLRLPLTDAAGAEDILVQVRACGLLCALQTRVNTMFAAWGVIVG